MTLADLQPYFAAASAALSVATLALILNIVKSIRDNAQDRIAIQEDRLKSAVEDRARLKEWSEREATELKAKLADSKTQVDALLKKEGIDSSTLVAGKRLSESASELQATVAELTDQMQETLLQLEQLRGRTSAGDQASGADRTIAMAAMASGRYEDAAIQYDSLAARGGATWQDHFTRGVAHANARQGRASDIAALLAYGDAVALIPDDLVGDQRARLFTYRAAMLKRLGRLPEAANDLALSLQSASAEYERLDAHYNLACVYAMQSQAEQMFMHLEPLRSNPRFLSGVAGHLHDYFRHFRTEPRLVALLSSVRHDVA